MHGQLSRGFEINGVIMRYATLHTVAYLIITQDNSNPDYLTNDNEPQATI